MTDCHAPLPLRSIRLGRLEITLVPDGEMHVVPGEGLYGVPGDAGWRDYTPSDAEGFVRVMPNALLIKRDDGGAVLIDAGGENADERPERRTDFLARLDSLGIQRTDVCTLIVTHAHLDHIGYLSVSTGGSYAPTFPNAEVFVQRTEAETFAAEDAERWARYFIPLERAGLLRVIDGDTEIAQGVTCLATPGHTPGHQSVMICSERMCAIYLGDLAATKLHLEHAEWQPEWTWSRDAELASKSKLIDLALAKDALVIFGHDPQTPFGRIKREGRGIKVVEVD
jgi:glyoxylase-like metal-dependent hydrolase (beta-lactamase superfamily II)